MASFTIQTAASNISISATANASPRKGAVISVGTRGDSYDNALAETVHGLYKTELIRRQGPWRTVDEVELATLRWVHWYNTRRLHGACNHLPPAEYEGLFYSQPTAAPAA